MLCRHCHCASFDDKTYASVLVSSGKLMPEIQSLETRIIPCVTAVCPTCDRVSVLSDGTTESVLCTLFMWQRLKEWIDCPDAH
jgi:hypothetical protein